MQEGRQTDASRSRVDGTHPRPVDLGCVVGSPQRVGSAPPSVLGPLRDRRYGRYRVHASATGLTADRGRRDDRRESVTRLVLALVVGRAPVPRGRARSARARRWPSSARRGCLTRGRLDREVRLEDVTAQREGLARDLRQAGLVDRRRGLAARVARADRRRAGDGTDRRARPARGRDRDAGQVHAGRRLLLARTKPTSLLSRVRIISWTDLSEQVTSNSWVNRNV